MAGRRLLMTGIFFAAGAVAGAAADAVSVPVRNVELYKNGMGFFEHVGPVDDSQEVEIALPGSQLNDVLKSLTVLDLGKGEVAGITYDSVASADRRLAEIPVDLTSAEGIVSFLNRIRGAELEAETPSGVVAGKLMGAEMRIFVSGPGVSAQKTLISILAADGHIHVVELESAGALKLTDPALADDLSRGLSILDSSHQRDVRKLRIQVAGSGRRELYIGYTSETPIWKTTYRVVLDAEQKPLLQGWAIVDNTTPMDWNNVSLSLVAGAPISFIQNLSQPIYSQRPVIPVSQRIQALPSASEATMELLDFQKVQEESEDAGLYMMQADEMLYEMPPEPPRAPSRRESVQKISAAGAMAPEAAPIGGMSRRQNTPAAQGQAVGEQFEYRLKQPVTIRRNESALLPVLQTDIEGEKVSVFNPQNREANPRLAFSLKNSSGLTLDGGAVTVIDSNTFAGEGLIGTVQPGETRLIGYAIDQGTEISVNSGSERQRVERVAVSQGVIRFYSKEVEKTVYKIRNNNEAKRTLVLEHPIRAEWNLTSARPEETSANFYRFRVEAPAKTTVEFTVQEEMPASDGFRVSSVNPDRIEVWVRAGSLDAGTEKLLREAADMQAAIHDLTQKITSLETEQKDIFADQERVRANLQRLGQSPDEANLRRRYVLQLDEQENLISAGRMEKEKLESDRAAANQRMEAFILKMSVDKKL